MPLTGSLLSRWTAAWICPLCFASLANVAKAQDQTCIAPIEYIALDGGVAGLDANGLAALGSYERISPDGRYVLRSYSGARLGEVSLIELPFSAAGKGSVTASRAFKTPLRNEAFPVQGTWRYVVNTNGDHYRLRDIVMQQSAAKPLFRGGMSGFYAAAAELEPYTAATIKIRSLSWPNSSGIEAQGEGALQVRTISVRDEGTKAQVISDTGSQFICRERVSEDGSFYALPMLSVDGLEFSAMPQSPRVGEATTRIYGLGTQIEQPSCSLHTALDTSSGKATFGFAAAAASNGRFSADLAYEYRRDVWWYSRALIRDFNVANFSNVAGQPERQTLAGAFPGITRDGRVIYAATWFELPTPGTDCGSMGLPSGQCKKATGYVVLDPYQHPEVRQALMQQTAAGAPSKTCITHTEVRAVRAAFAQFHGLE